MTQATNKYWTFANLPSIVKRWLAIENSCRKTENSRENRKQRTGKTLISDFQFRYGFPISDNRFQSTDFPSTYTEKRENAKVKLNILSKGVVLSKILLLSLLLMLFGAGSLQAATTATITITVTLNTAPTATAPPAPTQATDGSGLVTIETTIDDAEDDDTCKFQVEYSVDSGTNYYSAYIDSVVSATNTPNPAVDNGATYQIGTSAAYVLTSAGANTITFKWDTQNAGNGEQTIRTGDISTVRLRITPHDGTVAGTAVTSTADFTVDNEDPAAPTMTGEPTYTIGTTNTIDWGTVTDGAYYYAECDSADTFNSADLQTSGWIAGTSKEFTGLVDGTKYYYRVKAKDEVGNQSTWSATEYSTQDDTAPTAPGAVYDGTGTDIDYTASTTQLSSNWTAATDDTSGVAKYWYAIGTTAGGTDTVAWTDIGNVLTVTKSGLSLTDGTTYYFTVKAEDNVGNVGAVTNSDGCTVDATAPSTPVVTDDGTYTASSTQLHATWSSSDSGSGIVDNQYKIGTTSGGSDVVDWTSTSTTQEVTKTGLTLTDGQVYYFAVKTQNGALAWSEVGNSDGITVDTTAPSPAPTMNAEPEWTGGTTNTVSWDISGVTETGSGLKDYYAECDNDSDFLSVNLNSGWITDTSYQFEGLTDGTKYYYRVKCRDNVLNESGFSASVYSTQDTTNPGDPDVEPEPTYTTGTTNKIIWSGSYGACFYQVEADDDPNFGSINSTSDWTAELNVTLTDLGNGTKYYYRVRAKDNAEPPNYSNYVVYDKNGVNKIASTQDSNTPDAPSYVYDGTGSDIAWVNSDRIFSANWETVSYSGASGIKYHYAIGTTAGGTDVVSWTDNGTSASVTKDLTPLSVDEGTTLYFSVKTENNARPAGGTESDDGVFSSSATNSNGQTIDITDPPQTELSSTHTENAWSTSNDVTVTWEDGTDSGSGLAGYYLKADHVSDTVPTTSDDWVAAGGETKTYSGLADSVEGSAATYWYIHIVSKDNAGNLDDTADHFGPLKIDAIDPPQATLSSSTHTENEWSGDDDVTVTWTDGTDNESGLAGYYLKLDHSATTVPTTSDDWVAAGVETKSYSDLANAGDWYIHIVSKDNAGNLDDTADHFGPIKIDDSLPDIGTPQAYYDSSQANEIADDTWQNDDGSPYLKWDDPESASDDTFYYTTDGTTPSGSSSSVTTPYKQFGDLGEKETTIKVRPKNGYGQWGGTKTFTFKYDATKPNAVTDLTATAQTNNNIVLSWTAASDLPASGAGISYYRIYRSETSGTLGSQINSDGATTTAAYTDTYVAGSNLEKAKRYYYTIYPVDGAGNVQATGNNQANNMCGPIITGTIKDSITKELVPFKVTVELLDSAGTTVITSVTSENSGTYNIFNVDSGDYKLRFSCSHSTEYYKSKTVSVTVSSQVVQNVLLDPCGFVYDSVTGDFIAGATVTLYNAEGTITITPEANPQVTPSDGTYSFSVSPGHYYLTSSAPNYKFYKGSTFTVSTTVVTYNIPMDPLTLSSQPNMSISKSSNKNSVVLGDIITYTVVVKNLSTSSISNVQITDIAPYNFKIISGTSTLDGVLVSDPSGNNPYVWSIGSLAANTSTTLKYRMRVGVDARIGNNQNSASVAGTGSGNSAGPVFCTVRVREGLLTDRGIIIGKVFNDRNENGFQDKGEEVIGKVRLVMEDGTVITTDEFGRYSIINVKPGMHVIRLDNRLDSSGRLATAKTQNLTERRKEKPGYPVTRLPGYPVTLRPMSIFVDLPKGGMAKGNFAVTLTEEQIQELKRIAKEKVRKWESEKVRREEQRIAEEKARKAAKEAKEANKRKKKELEKELAKHYERGKSYYKEKGYIEAIDEFREVLSLDIKHKGANRYLDKLEKKAKKGQLSKAATKRIKEEKRRIGEREKRRREEERRKEESRRIGESEKRRRREAEKRRNGEAEKQRREKERELEKRYQEARGLYGDGQYRKAINGFESVLTLNPEHKQAKKYILKSRIKLIEEETGKRIEEVQSPKSKVQGQKREKLTPEEQEEMERLYHQGKRYYRDGKYREAAETLGKIQDTRYKIQKKAEKYLVKAQIKLIEIEKEEKIKVVKREAKAAEPAKPVGKTDIIFVGLADGELGKLSASGNVDNFEEGTDKYEDGFYKDSRLAYYLKARIKGKYLITSRLDTSQDYQDRLFKEIDPDRFYPIYGDASTTVNEVESQDKLYIRFDIDKSYAMYGNYQTSEFEKTEFSKYSRVLHGVKGHFENKGYAKRGVSITVIGSQVPQSAAKDEIAAEGISGPYYLAHSPVLAYTERVVIEVRDKERPEMVLKTEEKKRSEDYSIDYDRGRIIFNSPVASWDSDGNPVYIVVKYEYLLRTGEEDLTDNHIWGVRSELRPFKPLTIGSTYVEEKTSGAIEWQLFGADVRWKPVKGLEVYTEAATDDVPGETLEAFRKETSAYKVETTYDVPDLRARFLRLGKRGPERLKLKSYYKRVGRDFSNPQNVSEVGVERYGLTADLKLTKYTSSVWDYYRSLGLVADDTTDSYSWALKRKKGRLTTQAKYELKEYDDRSRVLTDTREHIGSALVGWDWTKYLSSSVKQEIDWKKERHVSEPTEERTDTTTFLTEYKTDTKKLYLRHEYLDSVDKTTNTSALGIEQRIDEHFKEYAEFQLKERNKEIKQGINARYDLTRTLSTDFNLERIKSIGTPEYRSDAASVALKYRPNDRLSTSIKYERRRQANDYVKHLGIYDIRGKATDSLSLLAKFSYGEKRDRAQDKVTLQDRDIILGIAYRPVKHDRLNLLAKYQMKDTKDSSSPSVMTDSRIWITSLEGIYDITKRLHLLGKYAYRNVEETTSGINSEAQIDVITGRLTYDITKRLDIMGENRLLRLRDVGDAKSEYAGELGYTFLDTIRLAGGYRCLDYEDGEVPGSDYRAEGPYFRVSGKFSPVKKTPLEKKIAKHYKEGKRYYRQEEYVKAIMEFREVLRLNPEDEKAPRYIARAQKGIVRKERKEEEARIAALSPEKAYREADALFRKANGHIANNEYEQAEKKLSKTLMLNPEHHEAQDLQKRVDRVLEIEGKERERRIATYYKGAVDLYKKAQYLKTIDECEKILALNPKHKGASELLDKAQRTIREVQERERREKVEKKIEGYLGEGKALYKEGRYQKALEKFKKILTIEPEYEGALKSIEKTEERIKEEKRLELKKRIEEHLAKGRALYKEGKYEEAREEFRKANSLKNPGLSEAEKWMEKCQKKIEKREAAQRQKKIEKYLGEGKALYKEGRYQEALEKFKKILDIEKENEKASLFLEKAKDRITSQKHFIRAKKHLLDNEYHEARGEILKSLSLNPDNREAKESLERLKKVIEIEQGIREEEIGIHYHLAKNLYRGEKYGAAIEEFKKVLSLDPGHRGAISYLPKTKVLLEKKRIEAKRLGLERKIAGHYKKGRALYGEGEYAQAISELKKAIGLDFGHREARQYLAKALEAQERAPIESKIREHLARAKRYGETYDFEKAKVEYEEAERLKGRMEIDRERKEREIEEYYTKGKTFYANARYQKAMDEFKEVLALNPAHKGALEYFQKAEEKEKSAAGAARRKRIAKEIERRYTRGEDFYSRGEYRKAMGEFQKVLAQAPEHSPAREYLKEALTALREREREKVVGAEAQKRELSARKAAERQRARRIKKKRELSRIRKREQKEEEKEARRDKERRIEGYCAAGRHFYKEKKYQEAIREFEKILEIAPEHAKAKEYINKVRKAAREALEEQRAKEEEIIERERKERARKVAEQQRAKEKYMAEEAKERELTKLKEAKKYYTKGKEYYKDHKYQEAILEFEKVRVLAPGYKGAAKYIEQAVQKETERRRKIESEKARKWESEKKKKARKALEEQRAKEKELARQKKAEEKRRIGEREKRRKVEKAAKEKEAKQKRIERKRLRKEQKDATAKAAREALEEQRARQKEKERRRKEEKARREVEERREKELAKQREKEQAAKVRKAAEARKAAERQRARQQRTKAKEIERRKKIEEKSVRKQKAKVEKAKRKRRAKEERLRAKRETEKKRLEKERQKKLLKKRAKERKLRVAREKEIRKIEEKVERKKTKKRPEKKKKRRRKK